MDLATGLVFYVTAQYQDRRELTNDSDFSFFYRKSRSFTDNHPVDMDPDLDIFDDSKSFSGKIQLEYTYEYYYRLRNGRKQYFRSEYPTIYAAYKQAFPGENPGWADYSLVYGGLRHEREVGLLSEINYRIEGGYYLHTNDMHFSDYTHFKSSPLVFDMIGTEETFYLMDYYRSSTNDSYIKAHAKLSSPYMLLKLLPWVSERLWKESLSMSYLVTPSINNHIQFGYSMDDISLLFDIGVYVVVEDWKYYGTALRINIRL